MIKNLPSFSFPVADPMQWKQIANFIFPIKKQ